MGKGSSGDLVNAAKEQGAANKDTAIAEWQLNNPNQTSDYGSRKVTQTGVHPDGTPMFTVEESLNPQSQANLAANQKIQGDLLKMAPTAINNAWQTVGQTFKPGQLAPLTNEVDASGMNTLDVSNLPGAQYGAEKGEIQKGLDYSGVQGLSDTTDLRNRSEDALFNKFYDRFAPAAQQQQDAMNTRIANMGGVTTGTGAQRMMGGLLGSQGDQMRQGIFDSIAGGGAEAQRQQQMELAARGQGIGEINKQGEFWNNAQNQDFMQNQANAGLWNTARGQDFDMASGANAQNNSITQSNITNAFNNANLSNASRQQGLSEQANLRQMSLNELMAMLSGTQVNQPNFQATIPTQIQPPPLFQANSQSAQMKNDTMNSLLSGAAKVGAAAVPLASDARLKKDIVPIARTPGGATVYNYRYKWEKDDGELHVGVLAQDLLETQPDAVIVGPHGFYMVDYSKVQ